jgi:hypothetical protein
MAGHVGLAVPVSASLTRLSEFADTMPSAAQAIGLGRSLLCGPPLVVCIDRFRAPHRQGVGDVRSDSAEKPFGFYGAEKRVFVRTGVEIVRLTGAFQADDEGSIPFTRSGQKALIL